MSGSTTMTGATDRTFGLRGVSAVAVLAVFLGGCSETGEFSFKPKSGGEEVVSRGAQPTDFVEREIEAPEVFQSEDAGLWDGRPSLGGIWVAHPDVKDPERVKIVNAANGKTIEGALFRREREQPGPLFQVSSDAAVELGILAGAPVKLQVVALRKEKIPVAEPKPVESDLIEEPAAVETASLDPIAAAAVAIETAEPTPVETTSATIEPVKETPLEAAATPLPASTLPETTADLASGAVIVPEAQDQASLDARATKPASVAELEPAAAPVTLTEERPRRGFLFKPYVQIGIFSQPDNAQNTADRMRGVGIIPTVRTFEREGKTYSRVIVGPAMSRSERTALLTAIKDQGFPDAYPVSK